VIKFLIKLFMSFSNTLQNKNTKRSEIGPINPLVEETIWKIEDLLLSSDGLSVKVNFETSTVKFRISVSDEQQSNLEYKFRVEFDYLNDIIVYASLVDSEFRDFVNRPNAIHHVSNGKLCVGIDKYYEKKKNRTRDTQEEEIRYLQSQLIERDVTGHSIALGILLDGYLGKKFEKMTLLKYLEKLHAEAGGAYKTRIEQATELLEPLPVWSR
jgi:hypothetical protein